MRIAELMDQLDATTPSPEQRAKFLYNKLVESGLQPTNWDLICFAAELLGGLVSTCEPIKPEVRRLLLMVYKIHYTYKDELATCLNQESSNQKSQTSPTQKSLTSPSSTDSPE